MAGWIGRFSLYVTSVSLYYIAEIAKTYGRQWNKPSIAFYEKALNATAMSEWLGMRLEEEGIEKLKRFGNSKSL